MNSVKTVFIACILMVSVTPVYAATKCALLSASGTTCSAPGTNTANMSDWTRNCTTNGISTPLSGIVFCSETQGEVGTTATTISNKYGYNCWVRVLSPVVGMWVLVRYGGGWDSALGCRETCARITGGDVFEWAQNVTAPVVPASILLKSVTGTAEIKY